MTSSRSDWPAYSIWLIYGSILPRYSRTHDSGAPFIPTTVVFMTEALKYVLCLGLLLATTRGSLAAAAALFTEEVLLKPRQEY